MEGYIKALLLRDFLSWFLRLEQRRTKQTMETPSDTNIVSSFPYCVKCFSSSNPLSYASCGHLLCTHHVKGSTCAVCQTPIGSVVPIDSSLTANVLPEDARPFYKPFLAPLQDIHSIARFQHTRLVDLVNHQSEVIGQLNEKVEKYRKSMKSAKERLGKAKEYKAYEVRQGGFYSMVD